MAESPSQQSPPPAPPVADASDPGQYWCYHCDKRVSVDTVPDLPDVTCRDCTGGFVEPIDDDPPYGNQFIQVLRLIAQAAREDDAPPPPPSERPDRPHPSDEDYLRIELDGWDNDDEDGDEQNEAEDQNDDAEEDQDRDGSESSDGDNEERGIIRERRRDMRGLRLRDFGGRAATRRNRILDWADILMGLEDHSIELRLQMPEMDGYVGNPGDYVDAAGYDALLQNLAEIDGGGRRGAPPAAKSAILALETVVVTSKDDVSVCAVCKDSVNVGEMAKKLPCGHEYHEDCIVPWLGSRNTCPVCRFELPTDDPEYEDERKKRSMANMGGGQSSSGSLV
ncbi:hypothetical protein RJ640_020834 [Escallonia rubra]|uniref:RING-type E3 ubiquitin transferase n=1 Tax=Escallonia rubra TaxID=112253 RepID=A0AA88UT17_9ASTE|nr:hypothetical protein RJ640_020834 [Escallonia rubra]